MLNALVALSGLIVSAVPEDEDVVAGPWGALILGALVVAVALLCWSFTKQIKKAKAANEAGVYGSDEAEAAPSDEA